MRFILFVFTIVLLNLFSISIGVAKPVNLTKSEVLEVVIFNTKKAYNHAEVINIANKVTPILKSYTGFISRKLAQDADKSSRWIDIVRWRSLEDAQTAAKKVVKRPQMKRFISIMRNYRMFHFISRKV